MLSRIFALLSAGFLLAAGIMFVIGRVAKNRNADLLQSGHRIRGTVTGKYIRRGKGVSHHIQYRYERDGSRYNDESRVTGELHARTRRGDPVTLAVDESDPARALLVAEGAIRTDELVFFILTIVFGALGGGFAITAVVLLVVLTPEMH